MKQQTQRLASKEVRQVLLAQARVVELEEKNRQRSEEERRKEDESSSASTVAKSDGDAET